MTPDLLLEPDLKSRVGRIVVLLDHWQDFYETAARDDGPSGDGGVFLLPGMSRHPSVIELARALENLWRYAPGCSAHLFGYYAAPLRQVRQSRREKDKHGKWRTIAGDLSDPSTKTWAYSRVRVLPSWVKLNRVRDGVAFVAAEPRSEAEMVVRPWIFRGEPYVPQPLLERFPGSMEKGVAA